MKIRPDTISVEAQSVREVEADRADVFLSIQGAQFFAGNAALQKAHEVRDLVRALMDFGLSETQIRLQGAEVVSQSGTWTKSSTAKYSLRVQDVLLSQIADVVGIISTQKNISQQSLVWKYPHDETLRDELLVEAIALVKKRAQIVATELGSKLLGVYKLETQHEIPEANAGGGFSDSTMMRARAFTSQDLGLNISHVQIIKTRVAIEFRVSEFSE